MRVQVLSSGSGGNATLVRAGDLRVLADAGLPITTLDQRLECARLPYDGCDAVVVTHGHLDHARSAGILARRWRVPVHAGEAIQLHAAIRRGKRFRPLSPAHPTELIARRGEGWLRLAVAHLPHDADPTYGLRFESHDRRVAVVLTDCGRPDPVAAEKLRGAHVLVLEFNYDPEMLAAGPYPPALQRRIRGGRGHLSNEQAAQMLRWLAGPELHTVVLAHLSEKNNTPELARAAAEAALADIERSDVRVVIAQQDRALDPIEV